MRERGKEGIEVESPRKVGKRQRDVQQGLYTGLTICCVLFFATEIVQNDPGHTIPACKPFKSHTEEIYFLSSFVNIDV